MDAHLVLLLLEAGNLVEIQISDRSFALRYFFVSYLQVNVFVSSQVYPLLERILDLFWVLYFDGDTPNYLIKFEYVLVFDNENFKFRNHFAEFLVWVNYV